jgi:ATPase subunit of ABC transporter with duplicated ATPase domains
MIYGKPEETDVKTFEQFDLEPHLSADAKYLPPAKPIPAAAATTTTTTTELDKELNIIENKPNKSINIAVLGSNNAGKSALVNMLQGKYDPKLKPSNGFRPVTMMMGSEYKVSFYDLGGGEKIRGIRANVLILDEFLLLPPDIIDNVLIPFLSSPRDVGERIRTRKLEDELKKQAKTQAKTQANYLKKQKKIEKKQARLEQQEQARRQALVDSLPPDDLLDLSDLLKPPGFYNVKAEEFKPAYLRFGKPNTQLTKVNLVIKYLKQI